MKRTALIAAFALFLGFACGSNVMAADHRLGVGTNYWHSLDDIDTSNGDIDNDGFSLLASYQCWFELLGVEVDAEWLPDRFGNDAVSPQAYLLFGSIIYGGIGIGATYTDSELTEEPFYALKAGVNLELLPDVFVDISANYRFNDKTDLDNDNHDIDTDTIFLGAAIRFDL